MDELRQNIITRDWVIIAKGRTDRPDEFVPTKKERAMLPAYVARCPFCAGNEAETIEETFAVRQRHDRVALSVEHQQGNRLAPPREALRGQ